MENYKNVSQDIRDQLNAEAEAVQIILTRIDNDIYSTVIVYPNACEMWKAIEEWQRFVTLLKQSQELKTVSYHKLYDILKQHQNEVNELRAERIARTTNPLALVAQQQPVYHPQYHPTHYTQNSSTRSQQTTTRNRGKACSKGMSETKTEMKKELSAHQETISILSQAKEAQIKLYKTREDKELDKVIALENKVNVLDNIVYKTGQSVQTMNMLNSKCKTSFAKPEFFEKAKRANFRLYDIGCYNDNLALMLAPESEEVIHLKKES
nr:hypothetical protein [Tanacetum cinerariifolium]